MPLMSATQCSDSCRVPYMRCHFPWRAFPCHAGRPHQPAQPVGSSRGTLEQCHGAVRIRHQLYPAGACPYRPRRMRGSQPALFRFDAVRSVQAEGACHSDGHLWHGTRSWTIDRVRRGWPDCDPLGLARSFLHGGTAGPVDGHHPGRHDSRTDPPQGRRTG
jgi:hypothetical protein